MNGKIGERCENKRKENTYRLLTPTVNSIIMHIKVCALTYMWLHCPYNSIMLFAVLFSVWNWTAKKVFNYGRVADSTKIVFSAALCTT